MGRYPFSGYRRENGRVGIRNHVVILPLDDLSNAAAEAVAHNIKGTLALPHAYGRLQFGEDLELFFRTLIGTGSNPNVAACVVIGIEPGWTGRVVDGIAKTGKPVEGFAIRATEISAPSRRLRARRKNFYNGRRKNNARCARSRSSSYRRSVGRVILLLASGLALLSET
jgi:(2R)-sulfolactate sulfo-lyase subunit beta